MKKLVRIQNENKKIYNRVSFRKTSIGLVAVLIGSAFFVLNGQSVKADEMNTNTAVQDAVVEQVKDQKTETTTPAQDLDANKSDETVNESNSEAKETEQQAPISKDNVTITTTEDLSKPQMAGQNNINVGITIKKLEPSNKEISLNFTNVGEGNDFLINANNLSSGEFVPLNDNWSFKHIDNGNFLVKWTNEKQNPSELDISIPFIGNINKVKENTNASMELYINGQKYGDKPIVATTLTPYIDTVSSNEIIKGFYMGEKTPESEAGYGNIPAADIDKYASIQQWGFYFNYRAGEGTSPIVNLMRALAAANESRQVLNPLEHAKFQVTLNGNQILIPESIRVFRVPAGMAVDKNHVRHGIDDKVPGTNETYYHFITAGENENNNFENFLRDHLTPNSENPTGFAVDQSDSTEDDGYFYITDANGDRDYNVATESFFIQVDGGVPKDSPTKSSDGPLSASWAEGFGTGEMTGAKVLTTGQIIGSGYGVDIVKPDPDQPKVPDQLQKPDPDEPKAPEVKPEEPSKPSDQPQQPENPTMPKTSVTSSNPKTSNKKKVGNRSTGKIVNISHQKNSVSTSNNVSNNASQLPQTGEKQQNTSLLGLLSLTFGFTSFFGIKKRKN